MTGTTEKRKLRRFSLAVPVKVRCGGNENPDSVIEVTSRDISAKGAFINLEESGLGSGSRVYLEMVLTIGKLTELFGHPKTVILKVEGFVVRAFKDGIAVAFDGNYSISPNVN